MVINLETHLLKVAKEGINKWDVYRIKIVPDGEHKGERRESNHAYGCTIDRAVSIVIQDRIDKGYEGKEFDADKFMKKYEEISNKVLTVFKKELSRMKK